MRPTLHCLLSLLLLAVSACDQSGESSQSGGASSTAGGQLASPDATTSSGDAEPTEAEDEEPAIEEEITGRVSYDAGACVRVDPIWGCSDTGEACVRGWCPGGDCIQLDPVWGCEDPGYECVRGWCQLPYGS